MQELQEIASVAGGGKGRFDFLMVLCRAGQGVALLDVAAGFHRGRMDRILTYEDDCFDRIGSDNTIYGIDAGLGRGFIAEENHFQNMHTGIRLVNAAAIDLIFWNNTFDVVIYGIDLTHNGVSPLSVGRVVMLENSFNLARIDGTPCFGIRMLGDSNEQNFEQVIIRKNVIAGDPESTEPTFDLFGIMVKNITNAIVENNVMSQCDAVPLSYSYCPKFKAFNNQKPDGTLLRAYEIISARYLMELQDFTEDALIGF